MLVSPAFAQTGGGGSGDMIATIAPLVLIFVVFYFLLIRPQQKKAKAHKEMVSNLRRGDQVITNGGIYGKVTKVLGDDRVQVEIAENVRIEVAKGMVADVVSRSEPAKDDKDEKKDDEKK
ncbi:MAG: preprotein translocase subunit YajC [Alphaproteobacteria bacterium]|nr:preprotein translocase subunit YajC [Alphaproteobacteria bacterium]